MQGRIIPEILERLEALEDSDRHVRDASAGVLANRVAVLEQKLQDNQELMDNFEASNTFLSAKLEHQEALIETLVSDLSNHRADVAQLKAERENDSDNQQGTQSDLHDLRESMHVVHQQGQDNKMGLSLLRDELSERMQDQLSHLQTTVTDLQLARAAEHNAEDAGKDEHMHAAVEACQRDVEALRELVQGAAAEETVSEVMQELSSQIRSVQVDVNNISAQVTNAASFSVLDEKLELAVAEAVSQCKDDTACISRDMRAHASGLDEKMESAFNAIAVLESDTFTAKDAQSESAALRAEVNALQARLDQLHSEANVQQGQEGTDDMPARLQKMDVEMAELHAMVQQATAASTLAREQLMEVSNTVAASLNDTTAGDVGHQLHELSTTVAALQQEAAEGQADTAVQEQSLRQAVADFVSSEPEVLLSFRGDMEAIQHSQVQLESTVADVSARLDTLEQNVEGSNAALEAAGSAPSAREVEAVVALQQDTAALQQKLSQVTEAVAEHGAQTGLQDHTDSLERAWAELQMQQKQIQELQSTDNQEQLASLASRVQHAESITEHLQQVHLHVKVRIFT